ITGDEVALDSFTLEPELLTTDTAMKTGRNSTLAFADIPPALVGAITAIEDRRFFAHNGLDPVGVLRAAASWTGLGAGADSPERQGGSTITQQLVKNTYLTPERTLTRKYKEALLAFALERRLSKPDIFALYCNEIYLGRRGATSVRGVRQAARAYFGKELKELSYAEAATIAGMIQSPARYAPDRHPEAARARRDAVLSAMVRDGSLAREDAERASAEPVTVAPASNSEGANAPYFVDYVNRAVEARLDGRADADERSLRVYTTLDADLQRLAEGAVSKQLALLDERFKRGARCAATARAEGAGCAKPQAALVAIDPRDGRVVAMVGGRDYAASQLNRATDARRQPGSVFKPFVYAAAVEAGASSRASSRARRIRTGRRSWAISRPRPRRSSDPRPLTSSQTCSRRFSITARRAPPAGCKKSPPRRARPAPPATGGSPVTRRTSSASSGSASTTTRPSTSPARTPPCPSGLTSCALLSTSDPNSAARRSPCPRA
ncbi:MAG: transglycosylase domain-containing protein, partial [Acidobacteria bacterium]|nr:transglycosylase domain-containing protein [Acidobacteriota bacterium]